MQQDIKSMAEMLVNQARELGSDRIVLFANDVRTPVEVNLSDLIQELESDPARKYKFQRSSESGFSDLTAYFRLPTLSEPFSRIRAVDKEFLREADPVEIAHLAQNDRNLFHSALRGSLATLEPITPKRAKNLSNEALLELYLRISELINDSKLNYAISYLRCMPIYGALNFKDLDGENGIQDCIDLIESLPNDTNSASERVARLVSMGKLASLRNRHEAANYFQNALTLDTENNIQKFYSDMGVYTYYRQDDLATLDKERAKEIRDSISLMKSSGSKNSFSVGISVDPNFFRIYGFRLLHWAQQMPDVDFSFILCCKESEAQSLIDAGESYQEALQAFNLSGAIRNTNFYQVSTPEWVTVPKTFYASARFFAADILLSRYDQVYLMDADIDVKEDPRTFWRRVSHLAFSSPQNVAYLSLSPWRKSVAGNVALNQRARGSRILSDLQCYLAKGLEASNSWMLDQNAITYAVERNEEVFTSLDPFKRPFQQFPFRSLWEDNFRKLNA